MLLLEVVFDFPMYEEPRVAGYAEPPARIVDQRSITSSVSLRISSSRGRVLRLEADALRGVRLGTWVVCLSLECSVNCIVELLPGNCTETFLFQGPDYPLLHLFSLFLRRSRLASVLFPRVREIVGEPRVLGTRLLGLYLGLCLCLCILHLNPALVTH